MDDNFTEKVDNSGTKKYKTFHRIVIWICGSFLRGLDPAAAVFDRGSD